MKASAKLEMLSDQLLEISKQIGAICIRCDSWWTAYRPKYWYDGFARKDYQTTSQPLFVRSYTNALKGLSQVPHTISGMKLAQESDPEIKKLVKRTLAEVDRLSIVLKANQKTFTDEVDPHTTTDDEIKQVFESSSWVDEYADYMRALQKEYEAKQLPRDKQEEIKRIENLLMQSLYQAKSALRNQGGPTAASILQHLAHATTALEKEYPNYTYVLTQLKQAEDALGGALDPKAPQTQEKEVEETIEHKDEAGETTHYETVKRKRTVPYYPEERTKLDAAIKHTEQILKVQADFYATLPQGKRKNRPKYYDYAERLPKEKKEKMDTWWDELIKLRDQIGGLSSSYGMLSRRVSLHEHSGPAAKNTFQQRLKEIAKRMEGTGLDEWIGTQYQKLQDILAPKNRLLMPDEPVGIIEMPVLVVRGYISPDTFTELQQYHYVMDRVIGNYQVIKNCLIFGVQSKRLKTNAVNELAREYDQMAEAVRTVFHEGEDIPLNELHPKAPLISKQHHIYAPLIPTSVVEGFHIDEWTFAIGKAAQIIQSVHANG